MSPGIIRRYGLAALACLLQPLSLALAAPIVVNQLHRAFSVKELHIHRGETVKFSNTDEFIHHLYIASSAFTFNSGEQPPGRDVSIQFSAAGTFEVLCEIHPRMHLNVVVDP